MSVFTLRGYAIPFNQVENVHALGLREFVDPQAFDEMLAGQSDVFLNFGGHGSQKVCGVSLFADEYGVGFSAAVPASAWSGMCRAVMRIVSSPR